MSKFTISTMWAHQNPHKFSPYTLDSYPIQKGAHKNTTIILNLI